MGGCGTQTLNEEDNMQAYEMLKIEVLPFQECDVICASGEGTVEDNYDWLD